jgi:hypothetical protein
MNDRDQDQIIANNPHGVGEQEHPATAESRINIAKSKEYPQMFQQNRR